MYKKTKGGQKRDERKCKEGDKWRPEPPEKDIGGATNQLTHTHVTIVER